jgi:hypothetical protein
MIKWSYPDTDEWKQWIYNSDWRTLDSWETEYKRHNENLDKLEVKEGVALVLMLFVFMPAIAIGAMIHPVLGVIAIILGFIVTIYIVYLMFEHHKVATDYDKGYPQSLVHPLKAYKEIQIRKRNENMEYDVGALGFVETFRDLKKRSK